MHDESALRPAAVDEEISADNARWSFAGSVPEHFERHIERSVPYYREGHALVADLSDFFVHPGSLVCEIGCSTGALTRLLATRHADRNVRVVGLEIEPDMVRVARERSREQPNVAIEQVNALEWDFEPCDLIVSYYTMQFVRPAVRQTLFDRVHAALAWGGAFVMFEKVRGPDARFQDILSQLYTDYKLGCGFSETEIVHKTRSLKGVLEPFSTQGNLDLLERAGFSDRMTVFKHLCFEGFLAIK